MTIQEKRKSKEEKEIVKGYFKRILWYPLHQEIQEVDYLYAHTPVGEGKKETLEEHLDLTVYYLRKIDEEKSLGQVRKVLQEVLKVPEEWNDLFEEMALNTFYMHDVGKCNLNFQLKKMKNEYFKMKGEQDANHALLSAAIYIEYFLERIRTLGVKGKDGKFLRTYMLLNAYVISKHHGHLRNLQDFEESLKNLYEAYQYRPEGNVFKLYRSLSSKGEGGFVLGPKVLEKLFIGAKEVLGVKEIGWQAAYPYIYTKLMYSLLVACDFYAASDYMEQEKVEDIGCLVEAARWEKVYKKNPTYQAIEQYRQQKQGKNVDLRQVSNINVLRSEIFLEAMANLKMQSEQDIFYLEAPTGGGKTNTSIGITMFLLSQQQQNKVFYVFPFNTLVEQTKKALDEAFKADTTCSQQITVVNSITPIVDKQKNIDEMEDEAELNYNRMLLDRQFFHYPWVITSHVQLFNLLFGVGREDGVGLYQLIGSVLILDEVQSYKNAIWTEMIHFLKAYAKVLRLKIVIMSATLPRLGQLTLEKEEIPSLISNREKYFQHRLFRERVQLDFSLLEADDIYEALMAKVMLYIEEDKKILIEFIKKKTAMQFYNDLIERLEGKEHSEVMLLTGDDSTWEREKCISKIKSESCRGVVLVATQLIEAGVDIDMDIGFKDISLLDAEEQFLGRINRSCKKKGCKAYFFNLDNATILYKGDCRKEKTVTLIEKEMQELLKCKNFESYYASIFEAIQRNNESYNAGNLEMFRKEALQCLSYEKVKKRMQLIDEELYPCTVFLGMTVEIEEKEGKRIIDGRSVWKQYTDLLKSQTISYAEKKVKLSQLSLEMSCFMWKVKYVDVGYNERIGDIFYIEEGEQYIVNGKFDRELLCGSSFEIL